VFCIKGVHIKVDSILKLERLVMKYYGFRDIAGSGLVTDKMNTHTYEFRI